MSEQTITLILSVVLSFMLGLVAHRLFGYKLTKVSKNFLVPQENYDFLKGKELGEKQNIERFNVTYTPYIERNDSFFFAKAEVGHQMQLFYNGLPIGQPNKTILKSDIKFKEENVNILREMITNSIKEVAATYASRGINYAINDGVKVIKKGNKK